MRILVLSSAPPRADANTMGMQQTFHRLRRLAAHHQITVAFANWTNEPVPARGQVSYELVPIPTPPLPQVAPTRPRSRFYWQIYAWYHTLLDPTPKLFHDRGLPVFRRAVRATLDAHPADVIHVIGEPMLYDLPPQVPNLLADFPDLYSRLAAGFAQPSAHRTRQFQNARELHKVQNIERGFLNRARHSLFVSPVDLQAAQQLAPTSAMTCIPNATDTSYFTPRPELEESATILFTGSLAYPFNIQAALWLAHDIFPRVLAAIPQARLEIVGYKPDAKVLALENDNVRVIANVPDVRPYLARAAVSVVPIRHGSGTRIKILESWAMARAVVSTGVGAEGIDAADGKHLMLADSTKAFAEAVIALLRDPSRRAALGQAGRAQVERCYSMMRASEQLDNLYQQFRGR